MPERIAFLLDYSPKWWSSIDSAYLHLCQALNGRNVECVVVYADKSKSQDAQQVFRENGVQLLAANYREGAFSYYWQLKRIIDRYQITTVHAGYFNYFDAVPWLARLGGVKQILFTEYTSGLWQPNSWWKAASARLRGRAAGGPVTRFIAVSDFIKQRLIEIGIPSERIVRVYLGVDSERFRASPEGREALARQYPIQREELTMAARMAVAEGFRPAAPRVRLPWLALALVPLFGLSLLLAPRNPVNPLLGPGAKLAPRLLAASSWTQMCGVWRALHARALIVGSYPDTLPELAREGLASGSSLLDPWDRPYRYVLREQSLLLAGNGSSGAPDSNLMLSQHLGGESEDTGSGPGAVVIGP